MPDIKLLVDTNDVDIDRWEQFVTEHPHGNVFQTHEMYQVYKNSNNQQPIFLMTVDENNNISGVLLAVILKEFSGLKGNVTARSIVHGGPLIKNDDPYVFDFILKEYNKFIKNKALYSQFRNSRNWNDAKSIFIKNGFKYEEHLNILIDLTKSEEQLWKEVHSKRRNEVRRASKEGTYFSVEHSVNSLKNCYFILQEVYKRAKLPIPDYNFFYNLYCMNSNSKLILFCAYYEGELIGCMLALAFKDKIYDFYAGSMKKFYNKYPNDLIPWEAFMWGKKNDYTVFDFGGAGKPDVPYGVRDYKKKFGGEFVNYGRFEKVHKPILFKIAKAGFTIWQKVK